MEEMGVMTMEPETEELMEYEDNSNLVSGLIGLGIGVAGTLLAKKGVSAAKKLWQKRKDKKAAKSECDENSEENIVDAEAEDIEEN